MKLELIDAMNAISILLIFIASPIACQQPQDALYSSLDQAILKDLYNHHITDLSSSLRKDNDANAVVSGLGISQTLLLLALGSVGNTFRDIMKVVTHIPYLSDPESSLTAKNAIYIAQFLGDSAKGNGSYETFSGAFISKRFTKNPDIVDFIQRYANLVLEGLDFAKDDTAQTINHQIKKVTGGTIQGVTIARDVTNPGTLLLLVSATYFKGLWKRSFDPKKSKHIPFYPDKGPIQKVRMMVDTRNVSYKSMEISPGLTIQLLELDYANDNLVMLYVLPPKGSLTTLVSILTYVDLAGLTENMNYQLVDLALPVFNATATINLKSILSKVGLVDLFGPNANLSAITGKNSNHERLYVNEIIHKATIIIKEDGVEKPIVSNSAPAKPLPISKPIKFQANRPFLYFVYDKFSQTIYTSGYYLKSLKRCYKVY